MCTGNENSKPIWNKFIIRKDIIETSQVVLNFCRTVYNRIGGVMVSVLASSVIDRGFDPWSGQTKDYKINICCFSDKHAALRSKSKD